MSFRISNKGFGINVQDGAVVSDVIFAKVTIETSRRHFNWLGSSKNVQVRAEETNEQLSPRTAPGHFLSAIITVKARGTPTITGQVDQPLENIRISNGTSL